MFLTGFTERHLKQISIISILLLPFSTLFAWLQIIRRCLYKKLKKYEAPFYVISVGNISCGGSGKTPFTIFLAQSLQSAGIITVVSHRGYKGEYENNCRIISSFNSIKPEAKSAGDEACLLAENLPGIPVIVGKNRSQALKMLSKNFPNVQAVILDDSFQHLKVEHDYDFVLINSNNGLGNGFVLPAGILREPLSSLKYADTVIFNGKDDLPKYLKNYESKIARTEYSLKGIYNTANVRIDSNRLKDKETALITALGNPESFERTVDELQIPWQRHFKFPDHYSYPQDNLEKVNKYIFKNKIDYLISSEKDYIKLRYRNLACPLLIIKISMKLDADADILLSHLVDLIKSS